MVIMGQVFNGELKSNLQIYNVHNGKVVLERERSGTSDNNIAAMDAVWLDCNEEEDNEQSRLLSNYTLIFAQGNDIYENSATRSTHKIQYCSF